MTWLALIFTLIGAYLTAQRSEKQRRMGFFIWLWTNAFWAFYNWDAGQTAMMWQFLAFGCFSGLGLYNNKNGDPVPFEKDPS